MNAKPNPSIAVVITTYNNPQSLELCLLSFSNQTYQNFDVYIADDGSKDETRDLILRLKRELPMQIYHMWHPDEGYRKAKINNTVFRQLDPARYPVLICVDHDVIVHPRFVEDHYEAHRREHFKPLLFMGRRVDLGPKLTAEVNAENVFRFTRGFSLKLMLASMNGDTQKVLRAVRIVGPEWWLSLLRRNQVPDLLGSNFSITTKTMHDVNGYNEDFKSYWGEDGDLFVRVRNFGVKHYGRTGYAIQWHLFHKRLDETPEHVAKYQELLRTRDYVRCSNGILK